MDEATDPKIGNLSYVCMESLYLLDDTVLVGTSGVYTHRIGKSEDERCVCYEMMDSDEHTIVLCESWR